MKKTWTVYVMWDETCPNPLLDGYVGLTSQSLERRRYQHGYNMRVRHRDRWSAVRDVSAEFFMRPVYRGSEEECRRLEAFLRPNSRIGWNVTVGGAH